MTACVLWTKGKTGPGYGALYVNGVQVLAHRYAYEAAHGPIPKGMFVLHRCDRPACVNVEHLYLGTAKDNTADAWSKGRLPKPPTLKGEAHSLAKLSRTQVIEIRKSRQPLKELSARFGVSKAQISRIKKKQSWKTV